MNIVSANAARPSLGDAREALAKVRNGCRDPKRFVRTFHLTREDDSVGLMRLTPHQQVVLDALVEHRFVLVVKYRQAYVSTIALAWLLGEVEYGPGLHGVFMAERRETAEDVFRRAANAYIAQPAWQRVPSVRSGLRGIEFDHGGGVLSRLQVMTAGAGGGVPALGQSVSRAVFTEFGFWRNQARVIGHLFPTFLKRPNARICGESTPGAHNCGYHKLVMANWGLPPVDSDEEDLRRYHVVFLPWWEDPTCVARGRDGQPLDPRGFRTDSDEDALVEAMPGITAGHLLFRRQLLDGEFDGDARLFESKYPRSVYDGWYSTLRPVFPEDDLKALLGASRPDCVIDGAWEEPILGHQYGLFVDPNSYGSAGDPSAHTLIDLTDRIEVGAWSGRVDPVAYADVLARLGKRFNNAMIVVEANAAACVTALCLSGYPNVWRSDTNPDHPGYYRTRNAVDRAHGAFVRMMREKRLRLHSRAGIQQCLAYDGTSAHGKADEEEHHYDRVVTYLMAADLISTMPVIVPRRPLVDPLTGAMSVAGFKALDKALARRRGPGI